MDTLNRMLLDRIQRSFPIVSKPYDALAEGLDIDGREVRRRIALMKEENLVRQISAIFNTGTLGYRSSLVAMSVRERELERAASAINRYPGVSHNYLRPGEFNIWYTIAVPPGESLEKTVHDLTVSAGGWPTLILPALKKYKLAVVLDVLEDEELEGPDDRPVAPALVSDAVFRPTEANIQVVRCIQEDLPLVERPFEKWAGMLGMRESNLLDRIRGWQEKGFMRRFAAVLNHRQVGFRANGMVVWSCPEEKIDEYGQILASHSEVSHCYHRPAYPAWPFNLYAMVHGRNVDDCQRTAEKLAASIQLYEFRILFSTKEFKKIRLKLFWD